jgi:hypothetical protein
MVWKAAGILEEKIADWRPGKAFRFL